MAIKEVKVGERYKLELLCIHNAGNVIMFETPTGDHLPFRESDLECVTPVEEPYSVQESAAFDIVRERKIVMTIPFTEYGYYTFEQAKAAAEIECARLNAEWRKEMEK